MEEEKKQDSNPIAMAMKEHVANIKKEKEKRKTMQART